MLGLAELRVKERDRLAAIAEGLAACGVSVEVGHDSLTVHGAGKPPRGGVKITTEFDHRIAMSFLVLGGVTAEPVAVDDATAIATSFPGFEALMNSLGARIAPLQ
jgi:3-phosphoshikimate 1-carboxyvinyltransferase